MPSKHLTLLVAALSVTPAFCAEVVLSDTTFNPADWDLQFLELTGSASLVFDQLAAGNPSPSRRATFSTPVIAGGTSHTVVAATIGALEYDPSTSGAISTLDVFYDLAFLSFSGIASPQAGFYRPALRQGGHLYFLPIGDQASTAAFTTYSRLGTTAANWTSPYIAGNPDFSESGGVIEFGYRFFFGANCSAGIGSFCTAASISSGLDNYRIRIQTEEGETTGDVPEPSTYAMFGAGLAALGVLRRKK